MINRNMTSPAWMISLAKTGVMVSWSGIFPLMAEYTLVPWVDWSRTSKQPLSQFQLIRKWMLLIPSTDFFSCITKSHLSLSLPTAHPLERLFDLRKNVSAAETTSLCSSKYWAFCGKSRAFVAASLLGCRTVIMSRVSSSIMACCTHHDSKASCRVFIQSTKRSRVGEKTHDLWDENKKEQAKCR